MPEFVVSVSDPGASANEIRTSLMYGGSGWIGVEVRKFDPEGEVSTGKITAIKRIRQLLQCSLRDAKFLADYAEATGVARWGSVEVSFTSAGFRVIDGI